MTLLLADEYIIMTRKVQEEVYLNYTKKYNIEILTTKARSWHRKKKVNKSHNSI